MSVSFFRKPVKDVICPLCNEIMLLTRCKQYKRTTYCLECPGDHYPTIHTYWYETKEDAIKAFKKGELRG